jgi:hypothetical protein
MRCQVDNSMASFFLQEINFWNKKKSLLARKQDESVAFRKMQNFSCSLYGFTSLCSLDHAAYSNRLCCCLCKLAAKITAYYTGVIGYISLQANSSDLMETNYFSLVKYSQVSRDSSVGVVTGLWPG